jgi:hypothetical protein
MEDKDIKEEESKETLEERFSKERKEWSEKTAKFSLQLKKIFDIPDLMTELYTERQRASEYYHYLLSLLIKLNKKYRRQYAEKYDYYSFTAQFRYPTEIAKNNRILVDLAEIVEKREMLELHSKFMDKTLSTLDNIIYAISNRIKIEEISRGK